MPVEQRYEGFLPGRHAVDGFGAGGFQFGGMSHRGSMLALPDGIHAIAPQNFRGSRRGLARAPCSPCRAARSNCCCLAAGNRCSRFPPPCAKNSADLGVRCDPMDTGAACQTYNILLGERRLGRGAR